MISSDARELFPLKETAVYLNHGGFGVAPREVMAARAAILREIEQAPGPFFAHDYRGRWNSTAACVASRLGVAADSLALVDNVTDGINAILRAFAFKPGDEILTTSLTYGAIDLAAGHIARARGATVVRMPIPFPNPTPERCLESLQAALTPRTRLAILDHVTSSTALLLPLSEMAWICRRRDVAVLVDGAHVPGNVPLDISSIPADWYVANLHKWYFVPRGCGFLWAAPNRRGDLVPNVLSWDIKREFPHSFEWTGTHDPSAWLSIPAAFAFMDRFGEEQVRAHNHALVREGMALLAEAWKVQVDTPASMIGSMALVPLPDGLSCATDEENRIRLQKRLWDKFAIEACPSFAHHGTIWLRFSAQIYNSLADYEKLARAIVALRSA
ncbi:MAG TPA: aminotransferase class V-fold PLP-dependent enzyme [Candidatus Binataceae bacterium]